MAITLQMVTDRTEQDVIDATATVASVQAGGDVPDDYESLKGRYNISDLNRVESAVQALTDEFTALGYSCPLVTKQWSYGDYFTQMDFDRYLANIAWLRGLVAQQSTTPETPEHYKPYTNANAIEQILVDLNDALTRMQKSWYYSGEIYCGEV